MNKNRSSNIFLMEIIIAILFFSLVSAYCVKIFVQARVMSEENSVRTQSIAKCTSAAEIALAAESVEDARGKLAFYMREAEEHGEADKEATEMKAEQVVPDEGKSEKDSTENAWKKDKTGKNTGEKAVNGNSNTNQDKEITKKDKNESAVLKMHYNAVWLPCSESEAVYCLIASAAEETAERGVDADAGVGSSVDAGVDVGVDAGATAAAAAVGPLAAWKFEVVSAESGDSLYTLETEVYYEP